MKMSEAIAIILENPLTSLIDFVTLSMMFTCFYLALIIFQEREMNEKLLDNYDKIVVKDKVSVIHCAFGDKPHTFAFVHVD